MRVKVEQTLNSSNPLCDWLNSLLYSLIVLSTRYETGFSSQCECVPGKSISYSSFISRKTETSHSERILQKVFRIRFNVSQSIFLTGEKFSDRVMTVSLLNHSNKHIMILLTVHQASNSWLRHIIYHSWQRFNSLSENNKTSQSSCLRSWKQQMLVIIT